MSEAAQPRYTSGSVTPNTALADQLAALKSIAKSDDPWERRYRLEHHLSRRQHRTIVRLYKRLGEIQQLTIVEGPEES